MPYCGPQPRLIVGVTPMVLTLELTSISNLGGPWHCLVFMNMSTQLHSSNRNINRVRTRLPGGNLHSSLESDSPLFSCLQERKGLSSRQPGTAPTGDTSPSIRNVAGIVTLVTKLDGGKAETV